MFTISRIDSFAHLGQHAEWREPLALVAQGESSCRTGRLRQCGPTTLETRSRAVDVQLLVRKHTPTSTITSTLTSTSTACDGHQPLMIVTSASRITVLSVGSQERSPVTSSRKISSLSPAF